MKPRAFLSYRHDHPAEEEAKDILAGALNNEQKVELIFDKSVTEIGDCVIEFMRELTAARCIFLFISEDYFKSAYTLYELISIAEHPEEKSKIVLPICVSSEMMSAYDFREIKDHWDSEPRIYTLLDQLFRYQDSSQTSSLDENALWRKIDSAWEKLIFPYLHKLWEADTTANVESQIHQSVDDLTQKSHEESAATDSHHRKIIKKQIRILLDDQPGYVSRLVRAMRMGRDSTLDQVVDAIVVDSGEVIQPIGHITAAARSFKQVHSHNLIEWKDAFQDIQQICGYLLLNAIDPAWWFNHELEFGVQMERGIVGGGYKLEASAFVEVIISKELITQGAPPPGYELASDGSSKVVPCQSNIGDGYNSMLFDGLNEQAVAISLLGQIHKDLRKSSVLPNDTETMISEIKEMAVAVKHSSSQKQVYYIVSGDYLKALKEQDWFDDFQAELKGNLRFICCSEDTISGSGSATRESQSQLLTSFANLLNIDRN